MLSYLVLLAATAACVSARYTVPLPIHYEIEAQLQRQTGFRSLRWDPTNYLTYLASVYAQCINLYGADGSRITQRGRIANTTAYSVLQQWFDPTLLDNNLVVFFWDIESQSNQDSGTVDRDIRKLAGNRNGVGALSTLPNVDGSLRNYDRFGCSVETACSANSQPVMSLICVFGQSLAQKQSGGSQTNAPIRPTQPPAPQTTRTVRTTRPVPTTRPATTRPRPTTQPTTTTTTTTTEEPITTQATGAVEIASGLYETYQEHSQEYYEMIMRQFSPVDPMPMIGVEIVQEEQKLAQLGLCQYQNDASAFTAEVLIDIFGEESQPLLYAVALNPQPTEEEMRTIPISNAAKSALINVLDSAVTEKRDPPASVVCAWALCSEKFLLACAALGSQAYSAFDE